MGEHTFDPKKNLIIQKKNVGMILWSGLLMDDLRIQALGKVKQEGLKFGCPNVLCDTRTFRLFKFFLVP
jgi:hypothetical protein